VISDDPLPAAADETGGDPDLPPGPGSPSGTELLPGPSSAAPAAPELVRAYLDVRPPRKLAGADPVYPSLARATRTEGTVALECTIDSDGRVSNLRVVRSHPLFDAAALEAVSTWRYAPTLLRGVPVAVLMTVTVEFRMKR
jgi:protein TonB